MPFPRRLVLLLALLLLVPALPAVSATRLPDVVEPLLRTTALALGDTTTPLVGDEHLVGVTWRSGAPAVQVRWHVPEQAGGGGWTAWETPEDDSDVPEPAERAQAVPGTEPVWRPPGADLVQTRVTRAADGLALVRVADGERRSGGWQLGSDRAHAGGGAGYLGGVLTRPQWGADERIRRGGPSYAAAVKAVVVHHTAGRNDYRPEDVPAKIRADYAYHVKARGWSDLGYNLVVDKFGRIWEGRAGGLEMATIGTHAAGFNTGTLGVSLLGDMTTATPTPEAVHAMARVAAYAGATWNVDPRGWTRLTSGGSPKYARGTSVALPVVHGHRDTGNTACPGTLYDALDAIRTTAAALLGPAPQILRVDLTGAPVHAPTPLVVRGTLSRATRWTASVRSSDGRVLHHTAGQSATAELVWDGLVPPADGLPRVVPAPPGTYTWTVIVDDGVHAPAVRMAQFAVGLPLVRSP
jgi:uncharacterized protein with LGFP repeats